MTKSIKIYTVKLMQVNVYLKVTGHKCQSEQCKLATKKKKLIDLVENSIKLLLILYTT